MNSVLIVTREYRRGAISQICKVFPSTEQGSIAAANYVRNMVIEYSRNGLQDDWFFSVTQHDIEKLLT